MIATHNIKIGGRWYKAGEEINSSADFMNTPEIPEYGEKKFTKTEIYQMPVKELRELNCYANCDVVDSTDGSVDCGQIDATCADEIVQHALFGDLVFG